MAYYGVWAGNKTGIFTEWSACQAATKGFKGAKFKKLAAKTKSDAESEYADGYEAAQAKAKKKKVEKGHVVRNLHLNDGINFFCDGACQNNPGPCSSGVAMFRSGKLKKLYYGQYIKEGSNNVGELEAVLFCLNKIEEINRSVTLYVDSQYTIDAVSVWAYGWARNNWVKKDNTEVKNKDLVKACFEVYQRVKHLTTFEKVKSHIGETGNELADRMAIQGFKEKVEGWEVFDSSDIDEILKIEY